MGAFRRAWLAFGAGGHLRYAATKGAPGTEFGYFGRRMGWRLLRSGAPWGLNWVLNPVSVVRYFEFDFAWRCLQGIHGNFLDIASPRLFSLRVSSQGLGTVLMLNPDLEDLARSREAAARLGLPGLDFEGKGVDALEGRRDLYDAIWSISVMEHIDGAYDEREALRLAWAALKPGGRLIITVPVAPAFQVETRASDPYGTQKALEAGGYFFQRLYDKKAIEERLSGTLACRPELEEYFGERIAGTYAAYEERWIAEGLEATATDPRFIADQFTPYATHAAMPGLGVAGLCYVKPNA